MGIKSLKKKTLSLIFYRRRRKITKMALKFVALLLFVCAAQAQIFGQFSRPVHINPEASTLEFQAQDLDKVKNPVAQFAAQISKIRESFHNLVPARFQQYASKGREVIEKIRETLQNMPQVASQQNLDYQHARECVEKAQPALNKLAQTAQDLLQQSIQELVGDVEAELGPLAEVMEAKTQEAVETIQETVQEVEALISQGKLIEARHRFNEGRNELNSQVTEIVMKVQEMGQEYPVIVEEAEKFGEEFYNVTFSGAQVLFQEVQECIKKGKN